MEDNKKSPIIERLSMFMEMTGLSSSQFADKAGIPRPSLSQMMHGRNKSLNNQVLAKLNTAFPELNIVWLLFGHGDMYNTQFVETSEPQTERNSYDFSASETDIKPLDSLFGNDIFSQQNTPITPKSESDANNSQNKAPVEPTIPSDAISQPIVDSLAGASRKKISSIIVFYSDSSFETFYPTTE